MDAFDATLFAAILALPLYLLTQWERMRLCDPRYIRSKGAAIEREELIPASAEVVGRYGESEIYASIIFMGMRYRFESVVPSSYRRRIGAGELYVVPGLLYRAEQG